MNAASVTPVPLSSSTLSVRAMQHLSRWAARTPVLPFGIALTLLVGVADRVTTVDAGFTLFYLLPVTIVAWFRSARAASIIAVEILLISGAIDLTAPGRNVSWPSLVWNLGVATVVYLLFAHACEALRIRVRRENTLRNEATDQLRHAERLTTIGKLAAGVAHELGSPLNVISGHGSEIARGVLSGAERVHSAGVIVGQVDHMTTVVRNLLDFARRGGTEKTDVDVALLCQNTAALLRPLARIGGIDIVVTGSRSIVKLSASEIQQVLINLITNAIHAMPRGGELRIGTREAAKEHVEGTRTLQYAVISVCDQGTGIAPDHLSLIFDPFFSTKEVGKGTGLGLSIAYGIVRDHGGFVRVKTRFALGTTFDVYLPL